MPSAPLTAGTEKRIALLFPPDQREQVRQLLRDECGNNLFLTELDSEKLDPFRFAVLKLSQGNLDELHKAIRLAKSDWRDLLMAAGFGQVETHRQWLPDQAWAKSDT